MRQQMNWLSLIFWLVTNAPKIWAIIQDFIKWIESLHTPEQQQVAKTAFVAAANEYVKTKDHVGFLAKLAAIRQHQHN
jgi:hypothetical protein